MPLRRTRLVPVILALALSAGLAACGGDAPKTPALPPSPGLTLYYQNCIACHGKNGEGVKGVQPSLAGTPVVIGDPEAMLAWVMYGVRPASLPKGQYAGVMPQFAYLSNEDLATLTTWLRSNFGNAASPVTPDVVRKVRAAHAK